MTAPPTPYDELNRLLAELTGAARSILGDDFAGAYLQGSFALGDADLQSDCDFLIPVHRPISPEQESALRALHDEIPTRQGFWTGHLEGSYPVAAVPAEVLRERMRADIPRLLDDLATWVSIEVAWGQRYAVTTLCRMLYTLETGRVCSKKAALLWAADRYPEWSSLCTAALEGRVLGFDPEDAALPSLVVETVDFAAFAVFVAEQG